MPSSVLIALGSNLGDRRLNLGRAIAALAPYVRVVRASRVHETEPVDAPAGSPPFLNMVVAGYTALSPQDVLMGLLAIEIRLGRRRTRVRNAPRIIDLDLILHSANRVQTRFLTLPHPRFRGRPFVIEPAEELDLSWAPLKPSRPSVIPSAARDLLHDAVP
jgi:2-amino-4-hydroxy-6-hydroxymethyldihydropteridine diphosphokinase